MKPRYFNYLGKLLILCLAATALFTACEPEDDDFLNFRPVDFFVNADNLLVNAGETITYQDSSNNATSREWMFEGGVPATSTDAMPTITYDTDGTYLTFVTTTFADGTKQTRRLTVVVVPQIVADFAANPVQAVVDAPIQLQNLTQGVGEIPGVLGEADTAIIYQWDVEGISGSLSQSNPIVSFSDVGTYDVTLTVTRRSTGYTNTITKQDFINIVAVPILQPRNVGFDRDGSSFLVTTGEPLGDLSGGAANFSLVDGAGAAVAITSIETPSWSDNTIKVNYDAAGLTSGSAYTLSFTGSGILFASESILGAFSTTETFYGGTPDWLDFLYPEIDPNQALTAMLNGKSFTSDAEGVLYAWGCNPAVNVLNPVAGYRCPGVNGNNVDNPSYNVAISGDGGATLDDLRDVGIELSFLGPDGTTWEFSQPVTDLRFHNTFGNNAQIPQATVSTDGLTVTIDFQGARNGGARVTAILESGIAASGLQIKSLAPEDANAYVTASVK
jgi:PKD repeat protein